MAELSTYNAGTHLKTGVEETQTSETSVTNEGNLQDGNTAQSQEATTATNTAETTTTSTQESQSTDTGQAAEIPENEFPFSLGGESATAEQQNNQEQATTAYDWKQEIGKVDKSELYQHLGLNEFAVKLNDHILNGGKAADFIAMNGIDFDTVPDEDLVLQDMKAKNPNLSGAEVRRKFDRLYGITDDTDEQEKEDKLIDLKSAGYQVRVAKKAEQANYKMPEPIPVQDENYVQWQSQVKQQEELKNKITNYYKEHAATKSLKENKRVVINLGEGVAPFNIVMGDNDINALTNKMAESAMYQPPMLTNTGELDVAKHQLVSIFEANPNAFINQIFSYGKRMGLRGVVKEGQNAQRGNTTVSTTISQEPKYGTGTYNQTVHSK